MARNQPTTNQHGAVDYGVARVSVGLRGRRFDSYSNRLLTVALYKRRLGSAGHQAGTTFCGRGLGGTRPPRGGKHPLKNELPGYTGRHPRAANHRAGVPNGKKPTNQPIVRFQPDSLPSQVRSADPETSAEVPTPSLSDLPTQSKVEIAFLSPNSGSNLRPQARVVFQYLSPNHCAMLPPQIGCCCCCCCCCC